MTEREDMDKREDIEMLAAEYVLGTLDDAERVDVSIRRLLEPRLHSAICEWEVRLSPMLDRIADAQPSADLLARIEQRITDDTRRRRPAQTENADSASLHRQLIGWQMIAAALAVGIIVYSFGFSGALLPTGEHTFVAVFQEGDRQPQFLLSVDRRSRALAVRPVATQTHPDKAYQLWILVDEPDAVPQSLGMLGSLDRTTHKQLSQFDFETLETATFGISLEPEGGSPTGRPSGPALHGKLMPASL